MDQTVILACSSFRDYIAAAQEKMGTAYPVIWLDERLHRDPKLMRRAVLDALEDLPESVETVLVSMGFCGGSWADVPARQRLVMPRADDCVSILLHTKDRHENVRRRYHRQWQESYSHIDVIHAGIYDCDSPDYLAPVREDALFLDAEVGMVPGSNTVLEKLLSGQWDDCFCVFEPGETVTRTALEAPADRS